LSATGSGEGSFSWNDIELTGEVTLLLGKRPRPGSHRLEAERIDIGRTFADELAHACKRWIGSLNERSAVQYTGEDDPYIEDDEYLDVSLRDLVSIAEGDSDSTPDLRELIAGAFSNNDWVVPRNLVQGFLFYAIVGRAEGDRSVGFVKQTAPQRLAKQGGWLTALSDTLDVTNPRPLLDILRRPVFILEPDVDLILTGDRVAVLRMLAFDRLFADLEISRALAPQHVMAIAEEFPFAEGAIQTISSVCQKKARCRRLLKQLSMLSSERWQLRKERIEDVLELRRLDKSEYLNEAGEISPSTENVQTLLEVLTSRYYTSDFDEEEMRADRARRRDS
jgi:hypothetical protein